MLSLLDSNGADYTILGKKYNDSKTGEIWDSPVNRERTRRCEAGIVILSRKAAGSIPCI
jgi:hypothetical protein